MAEIFLYICSSRCIMNWDWRRIERFWCLCRGYEGVCPHSSAWCALASPPSPWLRCVLLFALSAPLRSLPSLHPTSPCVPALLEPAAPTSSSAASLAGVLIMFFEGDTLLFISLTLPAFGAPLLGTAHWVVRLHITTLHCLSLPSPLTGCSTVALRSHHWT